MTYQEEADDVPSTIPAKRTLRRERAEQGGPRDGQDEVEEPGRRSGE